MREAWGLSGYLSSSPIIMMLLLFLCLNDEFNSTWYIKTMGWSKSYVRGSVVVVARGTGLSVLTFIRCSSSAVWKCDVDWLS